MGIKLLNGEFETSVFSGGEVHIRVLDCAKMAHIQAFIKNSEDVMRLLLLYDAIKNMGCSVHTLEIPYLPYARQDRICNKGEAFSLKLFCELINGIYADKVIVQVPHSDVAPALISNCQIVYAEELLPEKYLEGKTLVCPDAGAEKRLMRFKRPYVMATKIRNAATTEITGTHVYADSLEGQACLIIDDICDGGRTFIELAKALKEKGAKSVELYVTHGIFSKGMSVFDGLIDQIYWNDENGFNSWKE